MAAKIDAEIKRIVDGQYAVALAVLRENRAVMDKMVKLLYEKETIYENEIDALFEPDPPTLPPADESSKEEPAPAADNDTKAEDATPAENAATAATEDKKPAGNAASAAEDEMPAENAATAAAEEEDKED